MIKYKLVSGVDYIIIKETSPSFDSWEEAREFLYEMINDVDSDYEDFIPRRISVRGVDYDDGKYIHIEPVSCPDSEESRSAGEVQEILE